MKHGMNRIAAVVLWKMPIITIFLSEFISMTLQAASDVQLFSIGGMILLIVLAAQYFLLVEE